MQNNQANGAHGQPMPQPMRSQHVSASTGRKKPDLWLMIAGVVILVGLVVIGLLVALSGNKVSDKAAINNDAYQAVFLTNGQVYFGKLLNATGQYAVMEEIYYLQVEQSVQPSTENPAEAGDAENNVQLIKLGNELHGPEDKMRISSAQILFWENLKSDSKITEAINNYRE